MAAYNVNYCGEIVNTFPVSLKEARQIAKRLISGAEIVKATSAAANVKAAKFFYRGKEVQIVEERQEGWTIVHYTDGSDFFQFAVTAEIEKR